MGFFNWLFGKSKKNELVEETRVLQFNNSETVLKKYDMTNSNNILSAMLLRSIESGKLKNYKGISEFIHKNPKSTEVIGINFEVHLYPTEEIKQLKKKWNLLKYKCTDLQLLETLDRINID